MKRVAARYSKIETLFVVSMWALVGLVGAMTVTKDSALTDSAFDGLTYGLIAALLTLAVPLAAKTKIGIIVATLTCTAIAAVLTADAMPSDDGLASFFVPYSWVASGFVLLVTFAAEASFPRRRNQSSG